MSNENSFPWYIVLPMAVLAFLSWVAGFIVGVVVAISLGGP